MKNINRYKTYFLVFLFGVTLVRLIFIGFLDLPPDEAYYWDWSRNLGLSYYDHPPMVAYFISLFTLLGRNSEFFTRLSCVVLIFLMTIIAYRLGKDIFGDERAGLLSAFLVNIVPGHAIGAVIVTPDTPQGFFWVLGLYFVYKAISTSKEFWWYLVGVALGFGLLSKYTMLLFVPSIFLFLLLSKDNRKWLMRKEPYLALIIGLVVFSPVIIWNFKHDWISFNFQFTHGFSKKENPGMKYFLDYIGGQMGIVSPFVFIAWLYTMAKSLYLGLKRQNANLLLLFCASAPVFLFFAVISLRTKVEGNWPGMAYFSGLIAMTGLSLLSLSRGKKRKLHVAWLIIVFSSSLLLTTVAHVQAIYPLLPIPLKDDPTSALHGWREMGLEVNKVLHEMPKEIPTFILGHRHQVVGELAFYTESQRYPVYEVSWEGRFNQYNIWNDFSTRLGNNAVLVSEQSYGESSFVTAVFDRIEESRCLTIKRNGFPIRSIYIYKCYNFKGLKASS